MGPCCGYSYSYSYGGASKGEAITLTRANIFWLNSVIDRGASRRAVGRYVIRREYTDAEGTLS